MWKTEAYRLLATELAAYDQLSYERLSEMVGESFEHTIRDDAGTIYLVTVTVRWSDDYKRDLKVTGLIANADSGPFRLLDDTIVKSPT